MPEPTTDPELLAARRHLAGELRRLRLNAGLSTHQVATAIGVSQSKVSRIERGQRSAPIPDVRAWAAATGLAGAAVDELVRLAEQALTGMIARRAILRGDGGVAHQRRFAELERAAGLIREFELVFIPGLLQTAGYARQVMTSVRPDRDVGAEVAERQNRQAILYDDTKRFMFLLTEGALRWRLGEIGSHRAQLDRLLSVATLTNVDLAVIPQAAAAPTWHGHGFVVFDQLHAADDDGSESDQDDSLVYVETLTQELRITDPEDVALYLEIFQRLHSGALTGEGARRLITATMADLQ